MGLFVILGVSHFGFEGGTLVLIAPVHGHCLPLTFKKASYSWSRVRNGKHTTDSGRVFYLTTGSGKSELLSLVVIADVEKPKSDSTSRGRNILGPVVQSIVSLTMSLRGHLLKYIPTTLSNTLLFFVGKM